MQYLQKMKVLYEFYRLCPDNSHYIHPKCILKRSYVCIKLFFHFSNVLLPRFMFTMMQYKLLKNKQIIVHLNNLDNGH